MKRVFTQAEIKRAETFLLALAHEGALFWSNAFMSESFLYQGRVEYVASDFYKSSGWRDYPNENHDPITAEQILKFINTYMELAKAEIATLIQRDKDVAIILGLQERMPNETWYVLDSYSFGGWDNDPTGIVAQAKREAGLDGAMRLNSPYRKKSVELKDGVIYTYRLGKKTNLAVLEER